MSSLVSCLFWSAGALGLLGLSGLHEFVGLLFWSAGALGLLGFWGLLFGVAVLLGCGVLCVRGGA